MWCRSGVQEYLRLWSWIEVEGEVLLPQRCPPWIGRRRDGSVQGGAGPGLQGEALLKWIPSDPTSGGWRLTQFDRTVTFGFVPSSLAGLRSAAPASSSGELPRFAFFLVWKKNSPQFTCTCRIGSGLCLPLFPA
ncbi:hypothetical protein ZWY2020_005967 [Hordeum vulgare]|nr:hypothetical protein ZWY2020_005967 [Hordeum vulgare]